MSKSLHSITDEEPKPKPVSAVSAEPYDYKRAGFWYDDLREAVDNIRKSQRKDEQSCEQIPPEVLQEKNISLSRLIAVGGFSQVNEGLFKDNKVAVKTIVKSKLSSEVLEQHLPQELIMVESLSHDNMIVTQIVETRDPLIFVVMDLADMDIVDNMTRFGTVSETQSKVWISEIISAVRYLHAKGIAHRDLKLENLLLANGVAKLCDFTFTCYAIDPNDGTERLDNDYCGSLPYVAPEVLSRTPHDPRKSDIWSLTVCIFAMITFKFPFGTKNIDKIQFRQKSAKWEYPSQVPVSDSLDQLFKQLWIYESKQRPNIDTVAQNQWFQNTSESENKAIESEETIVETLSPYFDAQDEAVSKNHFDYNRDGILYEYVREKLKAIKLKKREQISCHSPIISDAIVLFELQFDCPKLIVVTKNSHIYSGIFKNRKVAIKKVDKSVLSSEVLEQYLPQQLKLVESLSHDNIIVTHTIATRDPLIFVVMDLADMDIVDNISRYGTVLEKDWAKVWISEIISAVRYLHAKGIAHRDLKLENLLLANGVAKLCDFTFTCYAVDPNDGTERLDNDYCKNVSYAAPEVLSRTPHDPRTSDIWSLGVCIFVMITFKFPFGTKNIDKILFRQKSAKWEYPSQVPVSDSLDQLFKRLWIYEFKDRPNIDTVAQNQWFQNTSESENKADESEENESPANQSLKEDELSSPKLD